VAAAAVAETLARWHLSRPLRSSRDWSAARPAPGRARGSRPCRPPRPARDVLVDDHMRCWARCSDDDALGRHAHGDPGTTNCD